MLDDLYNTDILTLSAQLVDARLDATDGTALYGTAREVSKLCGSTLEIDVKFEDGLVSDVALRVEACALGQSSAAILQEAIIGASLQEIITARDALKAMLKAGGEPPLGRFAKLSLLRGVADYPARHTSTLLAFEAAIKAIEAAQV
ncbi:MAG: iron-sulfur cluster assembly scaffold protein [Maricaulaceae bacterium]